MANKPLDMRQAQCEAWIKAADKTGAVLEIPSGETIVRIIPKSMIEEERKEKELERPEL